MALLALAVVAAAVTTPRYADGPGRRSIGAEMEARRAGIGLSLRTDISATRLLAEEDLAGLGAEPSDEARQVRGEDAAGLARGPEGELVAVGGARRLDAHDSALAGAVGERRVHGAGPRDPADVRARIHDARGAIQRCYERRLRSTSSLGGTLELDLSVSPEGSVHGVRLHRGSTFDDRALVSCVRARLSTVRLGRGPAEQYRIPMTFVPSE